MNVVKSLNLIEISIIILLSLLITLPAITNTINVKYDKALKQSEIYCDYESVSGSLG